MDNIKNDSYFIQKAIADINAIENHTKNVTTYDEFMSDEMVVDAVMFRLIQLIENVKNISSEFKNNHNDIPWGKILGFRNGIVHEYGATDYTIVFEIITKDIYGLRDLFISAIN